MTALVLGGASWNTMIYVDEFPDPVPQTVGHCQHHETAGSTGIGKAFALKALGQTVTLHAALGADDAGNRIREACKARDIDLLADTDPAGTIRHTNLMDRHGQRMSVFLETGSNEPPVNVARLLPKISQADVIFLNIVQSSVPVLPELSKTTAPIWVDLHDWDGANTWHEQFTPYADVIQLSDEALGADKGEIIRGLLTGRATTVICTEGREGAEIFLSTGEIIEVPAVPDVQIVDANGAGDTFMAAIWVGLSNGKSWAEAGKFAARMAAQSVAHPELAPELLDA